MEDVQTERAATQKQRDRWPIGWQCGKAVGSAISRSAEQISNQNEQSAPEAGQRKRDRLEERPKFLPEM